MSAQSTLALPEYAITRNSIHHMDLFALCNAMGDASVDMILCDLPYGVTAMQGKNGWDNVIPMIPMWEQFKRIIKPHGAIVLTASQPFTSVLVSSNLGMFRYEWIWQKSVHTNPMILRFQPMRMHESILVFGNESPVYFPQMELGTPYADNKRNSGLSAINPHGTKKPIINLGTRFPSSVQFVQNGNNHNIHPTQKPVALFEYLIRTYTREGDLVFDPCVGSGTTAVAAQNTGRDYICGDFTREYVELARDRVRNSDPFQASVDRKTGIKQLSLFEAY